MSLYSLLLHVTVVKSGSQTTRATETRDACGLATEEMHAAGRWRLGEEMLPADDGISGVSASTSAWHQTRFLMICPSSNPPAPDSLADLSLVRCSPHIDILCVYMSLQIIYTFWFFHASSYFGPHVFPWICDLLYIFI